MAVIRKKDSSRKVPTKSAVTGSAKKVSAKASRAVAPEERYRLIETTAYFKAERNGFAGDAQQYWLAAEKEVNSLLAGGKKRGRK